jgi:hypothetical protein
VLRGVDLLRGGQFTGHIRVGACHVDLSGLSSLVNVSELHTRAQGGLIP